MKPIMFTRGVPPRESLPVEALADCAHQVIVENGPELLQYAQAAGYQPLRELIAQQHRVSSERIVLGQGSLQILDILLHCLLQPGDRVAVEQPTYDRVLTLLRRAGLHIIPIPLKQDGLDISKLEEELRNGRNIRLLYTIPDFQNPSGRVMTIEERTKLVALSQMYHFTIIEDAPYRTLRYSGEEVTSLFDLSPQTIIQLSSFSKLISPGLRVGYALLPEGLVEVVNEYAADTYINPSYVNHAIVYRFIANGYMQDHLAFLKALYAGRLQTMLSALQQQLNGWCTWTQPQGGFFVGLWVDPALREVWRSSPAQEFGLRLSDGRGFFVSGGEDFIRLPFCALQTDEIQDGIRRLSTMLTSR